MIRRSSRAGGATAPSPRAGPHPPQAGRPRLSVVVPAFGEERRVAATVGALRHALNDQLSGSLELVIVDDGSADATAERAREAGADHVIRFPVNRGKGAAVRAGILASSGSAVVFTDADLSYPPSQVMRLLERIEAGWDVVVGSRAHADTRTTGSSSRMRAISGRLFNLLTGVVLERRFGDTQCGLKGFQRDAAQRLFSLARVDGFAFDVEVLWLAGHLGLGVDEVPVELAGAEGSTVRLNVDPMRMLRDLWRIRRLAATGAYGPRSGAHGPPAGAE